MLQLRLMEGGGGRHSATLQRLLHQGGRGAAGEAAPAAAAQRTEGVQAGVRRCRRRTEGIQGWPHTGKLHCCCLEDRGPPRSIQG